MSSGKNIKRTGILYYNILYNNWIVTKSLRSLPVQMILLNNPLPPLTLHILYLLKSPTPSKIALPLLKLHQMCYMAHIPALTAQKLLTDYHRRNQKILNTHVRSIATTHLNHPKAAH